MAEATCTFGGDLEYAPICRTLPGPDGMCPRHAFLVDQMGKDGAERAEIGVMCWDCDEVVPEQEAVFDEKLQQYVCHGCLGADDEDDE